MNASLPTAAGLQPTSGFVQARAGRGGARAGRPGTAVVARDGVGSLRARGWSARALSTTRAAVRLCALRRAQMSFARHRIATARHRVSGATGDGAAGHVAQATAHRRCADAAWTNRRRAARTARAAHAGGTCVAGRASHAGSSRHRRCTGHRRSAGHRGRSAGHRHGGHAAVGSSCHRHHGATIASGVVAATGVQIAGGVVVATGVGSACLACSSAGVRTWIGAAVVGPASPHAGTKCTRNSQKLESCPHDSVRGGRRGNL